MGRRVLDIHSLLPHSKIHTQEVGLEARYNQEFKCAFVLGVDELKKISKILERIGNVEFQADCADDISREFKNLTDLLKFDNPKNKEITRLHITAPSDSIVKNATIVLSSSPYMLGGNVSLRFSGRDDVVMRLREDILDVVGGMRRWYGTISHVDFTLFFIAIFIGVWAILGFVMLMLIILNRVRITQETPSGRDALISFVGYLIPITLMILGALLNRFREKLFPRAVFSIGQGKERFRQLERIQWGVVISFFVSLAAGIVLLAFH